VFVSRGAGRVNGAAGPLSIRGLKAEDDAVVYSSRSSRRPSTTSSTPRWSRRARRCSRSRRGQLAEGSLNTAKYALGSTFDATLVGAHARALTNNQVAAMSQDLDALLADPAQLGSHAVLDQVPVNNKIPLLTLVNLLDANRGHFVINREALTAVYVRRGLKRVPGSGTDDGTSRSRRSRRSS
jgi:hypothetical protein